MRNLYKIFAVLNLLKQNSTAYYMIYQNTLLFKNNIKLFLVNFL